MLKHQKVSQYYDRGCSIPSANFNFRAFRTRYSDDTLKSLEFFSRLVFVAFHCIHELVIFILNVYEVHPVQWPFLPHVKSKKLYSFIIILTTVAGK